MLAHHLSHLASRGVEPLDGGCWPGSLSLTDQLQSVATHQLLPVQLRGDHGGERDQVEVQRDAGGEDPDDAGSDGYDDDGS